MNLLLFFWLLFLSAGLVSAMSLWRPRLADGTAAVLLILSWPVWLAARLNLPMRTAAAGWQWRVDEAGWSWTAVLLLVLTAVFLFRQGRGKPGWPAGQNGLVFWLAAAAVMVIWAETSRAWLNGWMFFLAAWLALAGSAAARRGSPFPPPRTAWLSLGFFLIWLAALQFPSDSLVFWGQGRLPAAVTTLVLLALLAIIGPWPLAGWRRLISSYSLPTVNLLWLVPVLAAAAWWGRMGLETPGTPLLRLLLTISGLLGMMVGFYRAWIQLLSPRRAAAALLLAQTGLLLIAGTWAGAEAAQREARVLILAGAVLLLIAGSEEAGHLRWQAWTAAAAGAALVGLPLTAGFGSRSALYGAWLADGRWLLTLVTALIHIGMTTAVVRIIVHSQEDLVLAPRATGWRGWLVLAAGVLPLAGLLSFAGIESADLTVQLLILLPILIGLGLHWLIGESADVETALRQAFPAVVPAGHLQAAARRWTGGLAAAVDSALGILEGEGGLLWLLAFLAAVLLAAGG